MGRTSNPPLRQICIVYATLSTLYVASMLRYEKKHTAPSYSEYMESPRYNTMLAMRLTSLLRGFVYAYCFRVKLVADARIELAYDAYETPF